MSTTEQRHPIQSAADTNRVPNSASSQPIDLVLQLYKDSLKQIREVCWDIPDERLAEQFPGISNHPAWTLSHLWLSSAFVLSLLGIDTSPANDPAADQAHKDAMARFGPGSIPVPDAKAYEKRDPLLSRLEALHMQVDTAVRERHAEYFDKPSPEFLRQYSPTLGRIVIYLIAAHESYHLGQLTQWKKAAGIGKATGA